MYPDFLWEEYMVIGEADGEGKYADESAFAREKKRESAISGTSVVDVAVDRTRRVRHSRAVVDRARRTLAAGGWIG